MQYKTNNSNYSTNSYFTSSSKISYSSSTTYGRSKIGCTCNGQGCRNTCR
ncbi:MAG: hypothetical protein ABH824_04335 [Nanoarchaeota archaeon]|nr:hypothetical protein [Nanoarchaeota archaeon]MBU1632795.1 hypothetical protein [Nanoarchaeota archaeon]MBU1876292.1 hypothetical protein [Nanoarchaeota archaeon]